MNIHTRKVEECLSFFNFAQKPILSNGCTDKLQSVFVDVNIIPFHIIHIHKVPFQMTPIKKGPYEIITINKVPSEIVSIIRRDLPLVVPQSIPDGLGIVAPFFDLFLFKDYCLTVEQLTASLKKIREDRRGDFKSAIRQAVEEETTRVNTGVAQDRA